MKSSLPFPKKSTGGGFSLVEVAISMAVVAFGMITILGLLPAGLVNFKKAANTTVEAQIVQAVSNDLANTSFSALTSSTTSVSYYTMEGSAIPIVQGAPSNPSNVYYTVTLTHSDVNGGKSYPADITGQACNVTIVITNKGNYSGTLSGNGQNSSNQPHTYSVIVANKNT
jgi:uncharacterized protein (TIGR02598 family)